MANTKEIKAQVEALEKEQTDRVSTVNQINERMGEMREAMAQLKEAHDYTRGKIEALKGLLPNETGEETATVNEKAK